MSLSSIEREIWKECQRVDPTIRLRDSVKAPFPCEALFFSPHCLGLELWRDGLVESGSMG